MKAFLRIFLILVVILLILAAAFIAKYPFYAPWYRAAHSAEDYKLLVESTTKPESGVTLIQAFNDRYPYWLGTPWNFNGISEVPGSGSIACGYFVTTMMRDMHFDINRVKLAQCASEEMIKALVDEKHIKRYNLVESDLMFDNIRKQKQNLYIIGLDNHTGFVYNDGDDIWFIHSSGSFPYCVMKEDATACNTITDSRYKVLGCISQSDILF